jgi:UDP-3-O-[3-hydroxymyristoyl] glucosamine N-acyltransferase
MARSITLRELARLLDAELQGDPAYEIKALSTLQDAGPGELAFLASSAYRRHLTGTRAGAIILAPGDTAGFAGNKLVTGNPYLAYARASGLFDRAPMPSPGIHSASVVDESAEIAPSASIGPLAVIEAGVRIGEQCVIGPGCFVGRDSVIGSHSRLFANVNLYHGVILGSRVRIHSGAVIGSDGFGFATGNDGWVKIHQLGGVEIGDDVEIGAGTTIDRGALGNTVIGSGVIIDNQVQIAHNVKVGDNSALAGCVAIAGSAVIGRNCVLAGGVGIVGHVELCDGVTVTARSMITKSIARPGSYSSGTPFSETAEWRRNAVRFGQLDRIAQKLSRLDRRGNKK